MSFKLFDCKIGISFLFVALITGTIIYDKSLSVLWGVLAALIHEIGHLLAMIIIGDKPESIMFNLFDVAIVDTKRAAHSYKHDVFILALGPILNICIFGLFYFTYSFFEIENLYTFSLQNLFLGMMNLLPIESLDGGQILYILFSKSFSQRKTEIIIQIISFVVLFPLLIIGLIILLRSKYNFSLLFISLYLMAVIIFKNGRFI